MGILTKIVEKNHKIHFSFSLFYSFFYRNFKISLFRIKPPGFLNKKICNLLVLKILSWQVLLTFWPTYKTLHPTSSFRDALSLYDLDLYRAQKTREDSLQYHSVILIGCVICKSFSRSSLLDIVPDLW